MLITSYKVTESGASYEIERGERATCERQASATTGDDKGERASEEAEQDAQGWQGGTRSTCQEAARLPAKKHTICSLHFVVAHECQYYLLFMH